MKSAFWNRRPAGLLLWFLCLVAPAAAQSVADRVREDLAKIAHPDRASEFQAAPSLPCLSQNQTLICWSFATCSFLESEMARLKLPSVRLSVMYPAYCQYLEKARRFVQTRGASPLSPGDTICGVMDVCGQYGAMPAEAYEKKSASKAFDQRQLYAELQQYADQVKQRGQWDEERVVAKVRSVLDRHLGKPPETFSFNGTSYNPRSFLAQIVRLPWSEYVNVTSFESGPFNTLIELKVPDNWRHHTNFLNVPLPEFYDSFRNAVRAGFTVAVELDNTENCYRTTGRYCFIPASDVPAGSINQAVREARFRTGETADDHVIHVTGWTSVAGQDWFLGKDSWKTAWRDGNQGALFVHGDYVKLKVLAYLVHGDGVPQLASRLRPQQPSR